VWGWGALQVSKKRANKMIKTCQGIVIRDRFKKKKKIPIRAIYGNK
jgi:hypothetical protein